MKRNLILLVGFVGLFTVGCASSHGGDQVCSQTLVKSTHSWNGQQLPAYPEGQPEVTILRIRIPPHTKLPIHEHPVINAGVLLEGELTVIAETGETLHLKAGDPIVEMVNKWHYGRNDGDIPAEIIVVYAGIEGDPITVKKNADSQAKE